MQYALLENGFELAEIYMVLTKCPTQGCFLRQGIRGHSDCGEFFLQATEKRFLHFRLPNEGDRYAEEVVKRVEDKAGRAKIRSDGWDVSSSEGFIGEPGFQKSHAKALFDTSGKKKFSGSEEISERNVATGTSIKLDRNVPGMGKGFPAFVRSVFLSCFRSEGNCKPASIG